MQIGILGIGSFLPDDVRRNDWWPAKTVATWREKLQKRGGQLPENQTEGIQRSIKAGAELGDDPFNGCLERRVMRKGMFASEMEVAAGERAIADADIDRSEIGVLLAFTFCPDYLHVQNGGVIHKKLGLTERCLTLSVEAACNSFLSQLTLAQSLIRGGQARYALLIQSASFSEIISQDSPMSPWFGDGATAVIVGPVAEGCGIVGHVHRTDGTRQRAVVTGIPGKRWYDDGRVTGYAEDPILARDLILGAADRSKQVIPEVLADAGLQPESVDFYACHQGTPWLRRVTQEYCGLTKARFMDTYPMFGSMSAVNIPLVLLAGRTDHQLRDGDLVAMFAGGTGETWSSVLMRWGRG